MKEPFSRVLARGEQLRAAGECDLARTTGPLAAPAELLAILSPILSLVLAIRLDGWQWKVLGAVLPVVAGVLLARGPLRRWLRPRQWVGVTDRRVLIWRRAAAFRPSPRIEAVPLADVTGVELIQDDWDRRHHTHQLELVCGQHRRSLDRNRNATAIRDAIAPPERPAPLPPPADFLPGTSA